MNGLRPPWQSLWALIDGFMVLAWCWLTCATCRAGGHGRSVGIARLPWGLITLAFVLLYLWLYTRRYDWERVHAGGLHRGERGLALPLRGLGPQFVVEFSPSWCCCDRHARCAAGRGADRTQRDREQRLS